MKIKKLKAREIIDSRGNPTIEADIVLLNDCFGRSSVPSGASVGSKEALELRDNDYRFHGKGVRTAVSNVNTIIFESVRQEEFDNQEEFDKFLINLDGTENKSKLGANAILACSLAFAKACAASQNIPLYKYIGSSKILPRPQMNIINGGAHADNTLDFQEFMIIPTQFSSFSESLRAGVEIFHSLKKILENAGFATNVGDEGGFAPALTSTNQTLEFIIKAIEKAGYKPGDNISIGLDVAASEFYKNNNYHLQGEQKILSSEELIEYYTDLISKYPIISIEDPLSEFDWQGWKTLTEKLSTKIQIVGDDIFVTNPKNIAKGINEKIADAVLIKLNQIGTLTETLAAINLTHKHNYKSIVSHRSGETEDTTIAHLAVGTGCGQIKTGSLSRTDRVGKYNELLRIEEQL